MITDCPEHGRTAGAHCIRCYRDYTAKVWHIHAHYWHSRRPNTPESFYLHERFTDIPVNPNLMPSAPPANLRSPRTKRR